MRSPLLDRHSRTGGPLHRMPASGKLAATLLIVIATALLPRDAWPAFAALGLLALALLVLSRVPPLYVLKRLALAEPLVLGIALLSLFQPGGWLAFLGILTKSTLCLLFVILLAGTTAFSEQLEVLRRARVPGLFVTTLALMYRYLFLMIDEASRMRRARQSRQFTRERSHQWRSLATVAGQLFIRSSERAERVYSAMSARGWAEQRQ